MAFYGGRFDTVDTSKVDDDCKMLYRIRDNDKTGLNSKLMYRPFFPSKDSGIVTTLTRFQQIQYVDQNWEKMTEEERIENGLPTKYLLFHKSPLATLIGIFAGGYALLQYEKLFYPGGVVLKYQRKFSSLSYLSKSLPIVFYGFYHLYVLKAYNLNYHIDFYSDSESD